MNINNNNLNMNNILKINSNKMICLTKNNNNIISIIWIILIKIIKHKCINKCNLKHIIMIQINPL